MIFKQMKWSEDLENGKAKPNEKKEDVLDESPLCSLLYLLLMAIIFAALLMTIVVCGWFFVDSIQKYVYTAEIKEKIKSEDQQIERLLDEHLEKELKCQLLLSERCLPSYDDRIVVQVKNFEQKYENLKENYFGDKNDYKLVNKIEFDHKLVLIEELRDLMRNSSSMTSLTFCDHDFPCIYCLSHMAKTFSSKLGDNLCDSMNVWKSVESPRREKFIFF